jgi:hypothetical protein
MNYIQSNITFVLNCSFGVFRISWGTKEACTTFSNYDSPTGGGSQATVVLSESEEVLEFVTFMLIVRAKQFNVLHEEPRSVLSAREAKDYGLVDQIVSAF